ncbi:MAG: tyrosine-type recombinase/integrase [Deltaproteobacteria bacterium]|nr:tyrosine-type recombinase/integrase [Deltaproteobacteria bacterium]
MSLRVLSNPKPHEPPFVLSVENTSIEPVFEFLRLAHLRGHSGKTIRAYAFDLLAFYRFLESENLDLDILQSNHFANFILSQRKENAAPRTINRRLMVLRTFLNSWSEGRGDQLFGKSCAPFYKGMRNKALLGKSRLKGKRKSFSVKVPSILITPLSSAEIRKFLIGLRKYRDQAILYLMLFCGLRSCEVLSLDVNDIDFIDDQIHVYGKGGKERVLPIPPSVRQALQRYLDYERPQTNHTKCFVVLKGPHRGRPLTGWGLRTIFRHRRKIVHLKKANPHKFRHTFCTNMIRQGVSLPVVQKLMGHSDIEVTMGYVHLSIDDVAREYHQAVAKLEAADFPEDT